MSLDHECNLMFTRLDDSASVSPAIHTISSEVSSVDDDIDESGTIDVEQTYSMPNNPTTR